MPKKFILWFKDAAKDDQELVGSKGVQQGELVRAGIPFPPGFIITTAAYQYFITENNTGTSPAHSIASSIFPEVLVKEIFTAYKKLGGLLTDAVVSIHAARIVTSTSTMAPQEKQIVYRSIQGEANLLLTIKTAWTEVTKGHTTGKADGVALVIQKVLAPDISGVMTTHKTEIQITACLGVSTNNSTVEQDVYTVAKDTEQIITKKVTQQTKQIVRHGTTEKITTLSKGKGTQQKISDKHIVMLAKLSRDIEKHSYFSQQITWAIEKNRIYITESRLAAPHEKTILPSTKTTVAAVVRMASLLVTGTPVNPGIVTGQIKRVVTTTELEQLGQSDIVYITTDFINTLSAKSFITGIKKAAAIIIVSNEALYQGKAVMHELHIPAVSILHTDASALDGVDVITVNGTTGDICRGGHAVAYSKEAGRQHTATKLYGIYTDKSLETTAEIDGIGSFIYTGSVTNQTGKKQAETIALSLQQFAPLLSPRPLIYKPQYSLYPTSELFEIEIEAMKIARNKMHCKNVWLMMPPVRSVDELREVKQLISASGIYRSPTCRLIMSIETPENGIVLDKYIAIGIDGVAINIQHLRSLLLGTVDNQRTSTVSLEKDTALLWAMERIIKLCHTYHITSNIYADTLDTHIVQEAVRFGITSISVSPAHIEATRKIIAEKEKKLIA